MAQSLLMYPRQESSEDEDAIPLETFKKDVDEEGGTRPASPLPSPPCIKVALPVVRRERMVERPAVRIYGTLMVGSKGETDGLNPPQILILVATDDFFLLENNALTFTFLLVVMLLFSMSLFVIDCYWKSQPTKANLANNVRMQCT